MKWITFVAGMGVHVNSDGREKAMITIEPWEYEIKIRCANGKVVGIDWHELVFYKTKEFQKVSNYQIKHLVRKHLSQAQKMMDEREKQ